MLDEEYVKRLFAEGFFKRWAPEERGALKALLIQQRLDVIELSNAEDKTVLDVGTGKARFAISFALAGAREVTAIDLSKAMLARASESARRVGVTNKIIFEQGDGEQLRYEDQYFDIVCCMGTFVHLPNPFKAMRELTRVCKIGGLVVADATNDPLLWREHYPSWTQCCPSKPTMKTVIYKLGNRVYSWMPLGAVRSISHRYFSTLPGKPAKPIWTHYSQSEFLDLFTHASLKIEKVLEYGDPVPVLFLVFARRVPI